MTNDTDRHARIALRAYHRWEAAGRPDGRHEEHWRAAEILELGAEAHARNAAGVAAQNEKHAKHRAAALKGAATKREKRRAADVAEWSNRMRANVAGTCR